MEKFKSILIDSAIFVGVIVSSEAIYYTLIILISF